MLVNGVNVSTYKAKLLNKDIQSAEVTVFDDWLRKANLPLYLGHQVKFKTIKLQFVIEDSTNEACLLDISNLVSELTRCTIKFDDISFYYDCVLVTPEHQQLIVDGYFGLNVELKSGYAYLPEVTETLNGIFSKEITVLGNLPTPAKVTVTMPINTISVTITGFGRDITVNDLLANVPVIIDGELGTILQNGSNKFAAVDLWEFPILQPGAQTITLDDNNGIVTIKYKPKYL